MDRRRALQMRPASSEELQCWSQSASSLAELSAIYSNPTSVETIERANRLILAWPPNDTLPAEGFEGVKPLYKKLSATLNEVKSTADKECKAIEDALERLGVLIALRTASEASPPEKRNKRPRGQSPSVASGAATPVSSATGRGVSITIPARNSVGPNSTASHPRDARSRKDFMYRQLPLSQGRKVAFHTPAKPGEAEENTWILAVVTKCIEKNRYEVQDPEPQEDGQPGLRYTTNLKHIIPLPEPLAAPNSPAHLNAYPDFPVGATVMALYPDTSCFYRAEVIATPKEMQPAAGRINMAAKYNPTYKLKFEDDDNQEHSVLAQWVVEWPSGS